MNEWIVFKFLLCGGLLEIKLEGLKLVGGLWCLEIMVGVEDGVGDLGREIVWV